MTVDGTATNYSYNNSPITFKIKDGSSYTVTFSDLNSSYLTPQSQTFTAIGGNSRTVSAVYYTEKVIINISFSDNLGTASTVSVNNTSYTCSNNTATAYVKYGTTYDIVGGTVAGYKTPSRTGITAEQTIREVNLVYNVAIVGIFIEDTAGKLWKISEWDDSATPNSIAICNEDHAFGLSLEYVINNRNDGSENSSMPRRFATNEAIRNSGELMTGVEMIPWSNKPSLTGYNYNQGRQSTVNWANFAKSYTSEKGFSGEPIMEAALEYTFANGKTGYNMCYGEATMVRANYAEIEDALAACSGETLYPGDTGNMGIALSCYEAGESGPVAIWDITIYNTNMSLSQFGYGSHLEVRPAIELSM